MKKYHFCVSHQVEGELAISYFDGFLSTDDDITTEENYAEVKQGIANLMEPPVENGGKLIMLSLTVIES